MGRKKEYKPVTFLRVFEEGVKLTEEEKEWLFFKGPRNNHYKRTKTDSKQRCPYCGKLFNMSTKRSIERAQKGYCAILCARCKETFYVKNDYQIVTKGEL